MKTQTQRAAAKAVATLRQNRMNSLGALDRIAAEEALDEYLQALERWENDFSIPGILTKELITVPAISFARFSDRNQVTAAINLNYVRRHALSVDVQCRQLSDLYGIQLEPEHIFNYIIAHPFGHQTYPVFEQLKQTQEAFKSIAGFYPTRSFANAWFRKASPVTAGPF